MPLLEIKNLVKYYGDTLALNDINLSVKKGEVVVILGPSGCGKSTLLRCINGLEEIKSGQLILQNEGELGKDLPWVKARQHIGMVFQSYELFPHMSVIDNILLGPLKVQKRQRAKVEAQADMLLKRVGLFERCTRSADPNPARPVAATNRRSPPGACRVRSSSSLPRPRGRSALAMTGASAVGSRVFLRGGAHRPASSSSRD